MWMRETPRLAIDSRVHSLSADFSHRYFTVNNLYNVAANAHIGDDVSVLVGANVKITGPSHLDSLLD